MDNDIHGDAAQELKRGWTVILTSALGCGLGYTALVFYTFGLFIDPIANEFGGRRVAIVCVPLFAAMLHATAKWSEAFKLPAKDVASVGFAAERLS